MKRNLSMAILLTLVFSFIFVPTDGSTRAANSSFLYFGRYIQTLIKDQADINYLSKQHLDDNNEVVINGVRIKKAGSSYYKETPIKWRVISSSDGYYTLMSEYILANRPFGYSYWDESEIRKWLNDEFLSSAFTEEEQNDILLNDIITQKKDYDDVYINHSDTEYNVFSKDKVYLLSAEEAILPEYGFSSDKNDLDASRKAVATDFVDNNNSPQNWWLRGRTFWSYGNLKNQYVGSEGKIKDWYGTYSYGIRPVIRIKNDSSYILNEYSDERIATSCSFSFPCWYRDGSTKKVVETEASYDDDFFIQKSSLRNGKLAKYSVLAASAAYDNEHSVLFLEKSGFKDIECVYSGTVAKKNQTDKPTKKNNDHVLVYFANKQIQLENENPFTLVGVVIKGTSGNYEWISNFNIGKGKVHKGFKQASDEVYVALKEYMIKENLSGDLKFWVTGHSRGAAVGNLVGKRLTDSYKKENVYCYTFATPRVSREKSVKKKGYENIKNYLNDGDFVTEVAPFVKDTKKKKYGWKFKRYGDDIILDNNCKDLMKSFFYSSVGVKYGGFTKKRKESLVKKFVDYAGKNQDSYYKIDYKHKGNCAPVHFFRDGLGAGLSSTGLFNLGLVDLSLDGYSKAISIAANNPKAAKVLTQMIVDGKLSDKFAHAHTQACYVNWIEVMNK